MEPIQSINRTSPVIIQPLNGPAAALSETEITALAANSGQARADRLAAELVRQLPEVPVREIAAVFSNISTTAIQAAEPGQSFEDRTTLQTDIIDDLLNLRSVFDQLSQEELSLFVAVFQNHLPDSLLGTGQDLFADDNFFSPIRTDDSLLDSFFRIDVVSERGILAVLDLAGTVLDILSVQDSGSGTLESLLDIFTQSSQAISISDTPDTAESISTAESVNNDIALLRNQDPPFAQLGTNPPTIIEIAG